MSQVKTVLVPFESMEVPHQAMVILPKLHVPSWEADPFFVFLNFHEQLPKRDRRTIEGPKKHILLENRPPQNGEPQAEDTFPFPFGQGMAQSVYNLQILKQDEIMVLGWLLGRRWKLGTCFCANSFMRSGRNMWWILLLKLFVYESGDTVADKGDLPAGVEFTSWCNLIIDCSSALIMTWRRRWSASA